MDGQERKITAWDLLGIDHNYTGDLSTQEYLDEIRGGGISMQPQSLQDQNERIIAALNLLLKELQTIRLVLAWWFGLIVAGLVIWGFAAVISLAHNS